MPNGRWMFEPWTRALERPFVHVIFGARQVGKSTLVRAVVPAPDLAVDLSDPGQRAEYLAEPQRLIREVRALPRRDGPSWVVVDEAQSVPALFDAVQHLFDRDPARWRFVLTGSSARKLRLAGANLLPGRAFVHHLHPLMIGERSPTRMSLLLPLEGAVAGGPLFPETEIVDRLAWGDLPGVALAAPEDRPPLLRAYAWVYLEEELRREALIRDWPTFARFLRLAALESGQIVNHAKLARDAGISAPTVRSHYQLLEDMFVGFHIPALSGSPRKSVLSTPRFVFFDVGVRHAAAGLVPGPDTVLANPGPIFEQWVAAELHRRLSYRGSGTLSYFRTKGGAEVDLVLDLGTELIPIEVKWTDRPTPHDARHLLGFMRDHPRVRRAFVVCRCPRPQELAEGVLAIPWWAI